MENLVLHPVHLKTLIISLIFLSSLLFKSYALDSNDGFLHKCITADNSSTTFQNNLQTVFSNLASVSNISMYQEFTAGDSPNTAYGLYLCSDNQSGCPACVQNISVLALLGNGSTGVCKEGFGYGDACMVHYSNASFFGISDTNNSILVLKKFSGTNYAAYNRTLHKVLTTIVEEQTAEFASYEVEDDGRHETVYAKGQCTMDLNTRNCKRCLKAALVELLNATYSSQHRVAKEGASTFPSCQLKYDDNVALFGGGDSSPSANAVAVSDPTVSAFLQVAALGLFLWCFNLIC